MPKPTSIGEMPVMTQETARVHSPITALRERINPSDALAYYNRGVTRYRLGENKGAVADYSEASRINPNYAAAYHNRGVARRDSGDKPGAIQDFQKAADLFQQQGDKDRYEKAINLLRRLQ